MLRNEHILQMYSFDIVPTPGKTREYRNSFSPLMFIPFAGVNVGCFC